MQTNNLPFGLFEIEVRYAKEIPVTKAKTDMLEDLYLSLDEVFKLEDATVNNELIADYYEGKGMHDRAQNVRKCGRNLFFNEYEKQNVFDLQKVFLCHDPFCINCQRYKARTRVMQFSGTIEKVQQDYDLYLLTYTQKNTTAENYKTVLDKMPQAFFRLNRFLKGTDKIKGVDFSEMGYAGAVRAHETTFTETEFHPHGHALLALSKDLLLKKNILNDFSYSYETVYKDGRRTREKKTRAFSEQEILLQKIWYLLMNDKEVTKKNIYSLDLGYSCTLDRADYNSVLEVFKYSIKSFGEDSKHLTPEQFDTILNGITGRRMLEAYGVFREIQDREDIDQQMVMDVYDEVVAALNLIERPKYNVHKSLWKLKDDMLNGFGLYINRKALFSATAETRNEIKDIVYDKISAYNKSHKKKINVDDFFYRVRKYGEMRQMLFDSLKESKKQQQRKYTERSKARTRYAKNKLKAEGKSASDPKYRQAFIMAKVEYNNLHPIMRADNTGANLPF